MDAHSPAKVMTVAKEPLIVEDELPVSFMSTALLVSHLLISQPLLNKDNAELELIRNQSIYKLR